METQKLQYATLVYILAILGLPLCCCIGLGAIPSGIAYFIATSELNKYHAYPERYTDQDNIYTGKIIALVVLIINLLYIAYTFYQIYTIGWDNLMEQSRILMEQYEQ
ncbi:CCC motif membrane protein [Tenacibaculum maritimum]|uniref:CCC motif membrane protein n=1 Tax=Tenacibaculum maritimum TaxID=107401 RepID=UPI002308274C|nr:CCC motif membrane protein [Tenacibaculum maritimum]MDB0599748.1 CCC motif membrane protein [Tenacibaculum maritimum]MDB0611338.1 CCC motif membrane protein [Tenacibaculum maritimum]